MPAINVARTDTFESQRVKINTLSSQLFSVTSGGSNLSTGLLRLGDGTVAAPSLAFTNDTQLGIYRPSAGVIGFAHASKKISDLSATSTKYYRDFVIEKNSLDSQYVSILTAGENYDGGTYASVPALGGTGDGALLGIEVDGFNGAVTNQGSGYDPGVYQNIALIGGTGTGALFDFTVPEISGSITNGGDNYTPGTYSNIAITGGSGTNLQGTFVVDAIDGVLTAGSNYPNGTWRSISVTGGTGSNGLVDLVVSNGSIQDFSGGVGASVWVSGTGFAVNDVIGATIAVAGTQTFVLKAASGKYYLDGSQVDNFNLLKGKTYIFNLNDSTVAGHPMFFSTTQDDTASISTDGITYTLDGSNVNTTDWLANYQSATTRQITWVVPAAPVTDNLYVSCSLHANMGAGVTLTDATTGSGFGYTISKVPGKVSEVNISQSGESYTSGDACGVAATDLMASSAVGAGVTGSGFVYTLGGATMGAVQSLDNIPNYGSGYTGGDVLTLPAAVTNVSTIARGELDFTGVNFVSNAGIQTLTWSGIAAGSSSQTYTNLSPTGGAGSGAVVTVEVLYAGGNASYDNVTVTNIGTGYLPSDQLVILGTSVGGVTPNNDLTISVQTVEPGNPQITVASTTGVMVGDTVDIIPNINNPGQVAAGTVIQSVDSATQFTLSIAPPTPGAADIKVTNQNPSRLTVPSTTGLVSGMVVNKVSGTGVLITGTTISAINSATELTLSITPSTPGAIVVNFEPEFGAGSGFAYTIDKLGVISDVSVADGGNGYTVGDVLQVSAFELVQPETYTVTNGEVSVLTPNAGNLADSAYAVGDSVRDAGGSVVAATITTSTTIGAANDASYTGVASTSNNNGVDATFDVSRDNSGAVLSAVITTDSPGSFYAANDTITIAGALVGGATPADNIVLTVSSVGSAQTAVVIRKISASGGFIQKIVVDKLSISANDYLVKDVGNPTTGDKISAVADEYRFYIDKGDGNGVQYTPGGTLFAGNSYKFDLSSGTLGGHIFSLSQFRDGQWGPSRFEDVSATLATTTKQVTLASTTGMLAGMIVTKVSGDGIIPSTTVIASVDSSTQITLSENPTTAGGVILNIYGAEYTTGVTRTGSDLTIKITETTPTLYYYCGTEQAAHVNEGGEDNEEASFTINTVNPKTFGSGFQLQVTEVVVQEIVKGDVLTGAFSAIDLQSTTATITTGTVNNLSSDTATLTTAAIPAITSATPITITVDDPASHDITLTANNIKFGTTWSVDVSTGDATVGGFINSPDLRLGDNLKLLASDASINSLAGYDIKLSPDTGRIVDINTTSAIAVPSGDSLSRPVAGIVKNGCIRYNTDSNQYEGYTANTTSWSSLGGVRDLDGNTYLLAEETVGANDNTHWFINDNVNSIRISPTYLEFINTKKLRSLNTTAPAFTEWAANTPYAVDDYVKYKNNLYKVTSAGTSATSGNEPTHTSGSQANGTTAMLWDRLAVADLTFEDINLVKIGPNNSTTALSVNDDLRFSGNVISTDTNDLIIRPNSGKKVVVDANTTFAVPAGTTAERGTPQQGSLRYNSTTSQFEGYDGANWGSLGGVRDVDQNTYIIPEVSAGSNENILYFFNDGSETMRLTATALEFKAVDTIKSSTSDEFEITASMMTFDSAATTLDNTDANKTFLYSSKQNFDIGVASGIYTEPVLRLDYLGDVYLNTGFGTGNYNGVKIFDSDLKDFELADAKIKTDIVQMVKGSINVGSTDIYETAIEKGAKVVIVAENTNTNHKEFVEFGVTDDGSNCFHTEYGNLQTNDNLIVSTFEYTAQNKIRLNFSLGTNVTNTHTVKVTIVSNITKK